MKSLLLIPIVVLLAAGACAGTWAAGAGKPHVRELIAAAVVCGVAGEAALAPAVLMARRAHASTVSLVGLAGTVVHMFLTLLLAALVWVAGLIHDRGPFVFLLLAFYWVSLVVVVLALARAVRAAHAGHGTIPSTATATATTGHTLTTRDARC